MTERPRRWRPMPILAVVAGGLILLGSAWKWSEVRGYRKAIAEIEEEIDAGRNATAVRKLTALLARWPDSDEALYLLGICEMARGQSRPAEDAWARVPPGSPFAARAILGRMQLQLERGRLASAERIINDALADPRVDGASLPILLGPIYCQQGRLDETLRSIESRWDVLDRAGEGVSESAINLVRAHIELQQSPIPDEAIRSVLDQYATMAADDDRIWLGKANRAIRAGSYDEAAHWIDACLRRRPEDVPVWQARLDWAVATGRVAEAQAAMGHLPASGLRPARIHRLSAWLASRRGDVAAERRALERLIAEDPGDSSALDRLAELAARAGEPARSAEWQARKHALDPLEARYEKLHRRNQPARDAAEMARLAERLGRRFEARAFLAVATAQEPDRDDLRRDLDRLRRSARSSDESGLTLAEAIAAEAGTTRSD